MFIGFGHIQSLLNSSNKQYVKITLQNGNKYSTSLKEGITYENLMKDINEAKKNGDILYGGLKIDDIISIVPM